MTKYLAILTNQGAAKLANAAALGTKLNLTQLAVGDGNGALPTPDPAQTKLVNQKRIAPLNMLSVDPNNASQIIAEQIIPENEGGFWIREIGLYDDGGDLVAVANCPETYKPQLQEGSGRTQTIRMILIVSSTSAVTLKIDPAIVLATRKYADDKAIELKLHVDDLMAKHLEAMTKALEGKQPIDRTLSDLSGKSVAEVLEYLGLGAGSALPVGVPVPWPTATPPGGWLKCNGATFITAQYPKLALAYPSGILPDLRGVFIRGWDDGRGIDTGRALLSDQMGTFVSVDPNYEDIGLVGAIGTIAGSGGIANSNGDIINTTISKLAFQYAQISGLTVATAGVGNTVATRPRNISFNYIVRAV